MKHIKSFFYLVGIWLSPSLLAQPQLILTLNNNEVSTITLTEIRSIKYEEQALNLYKTNGSVSSWLISEIADYRFAGVAGFSVQENKINNLNIYPNPLSNQANISFSSNKNQQIFISIYDLLGKKIEEVYSGNHFGYKTYYWQGDVPCGVYFCRVSSENSIQTKSFIVQ